MSTRTGTLQRGLLATVLLLVTTGIGCEGPEWAAEEGPVRVGAFYEPVEIDTERVSTPGDLAADNLSSQIAGRLAFLDRRPDDLAIRGQVVGLLLSRAHYTGSYSDFDAALALAEGSVARFPDRSESFAQRAAALGALHLFGEAATDVERAEAASPLAGGDRFEGSRVVHAIALGEPLDDALEWASDRADAFPSYETLSDLASVEAALGLYEDADAHYRESLAHYRDVSPFPLAFVSFQRGVMWAEMADAPELAVPLYREAVRRLPRYVVANVHLAELEANLLGEPARAIARLEGLVGTASDPRVQDPEPLGLLGEILEVEGRGAESRAYVEAARAMYEDLLSRHPEAFADHGAEFFAGPGADPARAVRLSQDNLDVRPNPRAFIVAIEAALAAEDEGTLCATVARARGAAQASTSLDVLVAEVAPRCVTPR